MAQIFFFSPAGFAPVKAIRAMLQESHGYALPEAAATPDGPVPVYGVCVPRRTDDPLVVVDALTEAGVIVLPPIRDAKAQPSALVAAALARYGITAVDSALDIATKMHARAGMPHLRPNLY